MLREKSKIKFDSIGVTLMGLSSSSRHILMDSHFLALNFIPHLLLSTGETHHAAGQVDH